MELDSGTIIACPECKAGQIISTAKIEPGGKMADGKWESLGFDMQSQKMICHKCGAFWDRKNEVTGDNEVYTEQHSWLSLNQKPSPKRKPLRRKISANPYER